MKYNTFNKKGFGKIAVIAKPGSLAIT